MDVFPARAGINRILIVNIIATTIRSLSRCLPNIYMICELFKFILFPLLIYFFNSFSPFIFMIEFIDF